MASYNKVILMGNLTRDPELKRTSTDMAVAQIGIAVNRKYKDREGNQKEETTFVDCEAWGRTAETMGKYLSKGRPVFIEGRLRLNEWEDREGNRRSKLLVVVDTFTFVDSRGGGGAGGGQRDSYQSTSTAPAGGGGPSGGASDDDIPF